MARRATEAARVIGELMSGGLITVRRETPLLEGRDLMVKGRIRQLVVADVGGALAGIITNRDVWLNLPSLATSLVFASLSTPVRGEPVLIAG